MLFEINLTHKHPCNLQIETIDMYEKKSSLNTIKVTRTIF